MEEVAHPVTRHHPIVIRGALRGMIRNTKLNRGFRVLGGLLLQRGISSYVTNFTRKCSHFWTSIVHSLS